jgi:hypothetical protein
VPRRKVLLFVGSNLIVDAIPKPGDPDVFGCDKRMHDSRERLFDALDTSGLTVHSIDPQGLATCVYSVGTGRMDCMRNGSEKFTWSGSFASGNNSVAGCKNNASCESMPNVGPIPRGCWLWNGGATSKPGGRTLVTLPPQSSRPFGRDLFRTHSCLNPFGPSTVSPYCSEGCVTGTSSTVSELNDLIDSEPGSVMCVVD